MFNVFRQHAAQRTPDPVDATRRDNLRRTTGGLGAWGGLSLVALATVAMGARAPSGDANAPTFLAVFGSASLLAAACLSVGGLLGFLFGIPRTVQEGRPARDAAATPAGTAGAPGEDFQQLVNTNLEEISDWLTKLLVGVGLTQLTTLPGQIWRLAEHHPVAGSVPVAVAVIVNFTVCGFFVGYLLTRLFLAGAFQVAETALRVRTRKAETLSQAGAFDKAADEYEGALSTITPTTTKAEKRRVYEGLIFNLLYTDHEKAIEYSRRFIAEEGDLSPRIWAYLAGAYGQKYGNARRTGAPAADLEQLKAAALEAARKAVAADASMRGLLRMMWDPNDPAKNPEDDDLEVFYREEVPEFAELLGK